MMKWMLIVLIIVFGVYSYFSYWKEYSVEDMERFAIDEFEYSYRRSLRNDFQGPEIFRKSESGVEFLWFKIVGCDTTKFFVFVPKKGDTELESSQITEGCNPTE